MSTIKTNKEKREPVKRLSFPLQSRLKNILRLLLLEDTKKMQKF